MSYLITHMSYLMKMFILRQALGLYYHLNIKCIHAICTLNKGEAWRCEGFDFLPTSM